MPVCRTPKLQRWLLLLRLRAREARKTPLQWHHSCGVELDMGNDKEGCKPLRATHLLDPTGKAYHVQVWKARERVSREGLRMLLGSFLADGKSKPPSSKGACLGDMQERTSATCNSCMMSRMHSHRHHAFVKTAISSEIVDLAGRDTYIKLRHRHATTELRAWGDVLCCKSGTGNSQGDGIGPPEFLSAYRPAIDEWQTEQHL